MCLGFEMVDRLSDEAITNKQRFSTVIFPAMILGITTSIRVLGPLAGLLVLTYAVFILGKRMVTILPPLVLYGVIALLAGGIVLAGAAAACFDGDVALQSLETRALDTR